MEPDPAAAEVHRQVLQSTLQEATLRSQDGAECCVICLEVVQEPCEVQPCGHRNFDYLCALSWLYEHPSCPLCKASIRQVRHDTPQGMKTTPIDQVAPPPRAPSTASPGGASYNTLYPRRWRGAGAPIRRRCQTASWAPNPVDPIARRREIYQRRQFSKHVGSNRLSRYQELTPQMFLRDAELVSRARTFIRRELQVFSFLSLDGDPDKTPHSKSTPAPSERRTTTLDRRRANNAEFLLEYVVAILKSVDIMGSAGQAEEMLTDFLGRENTKLFLHETRAWLRSPYTKLEDWDRAVQYDEPSGVGKPRGGRVADDGAGSTSCTKSDRITDGYQGDSNSRKGDFYRPRPRGWNTERRYRSEPYRSRHPDERGARHQRRRYEGL